MTIVQPGYSLQDSDCNGYHLTWNYEYQADFLRKIEPYVRKGSMILAPSNLTDFLEIMYITVYCTQGGHGDPGNLTL